MDQIQTYGGIKQMFVYGSGHLLNFPFGFSVGVFHFQRGYKGGVNLQFVKTPNKRLHADLLGSAAKIKPSPEAPTNR
jgi:hypothetical protein